jgi:8-oxo-dGTP pyrophosphatase MutT (NUDIX family)
MLYVRRWDVAVNYSIDKVRNREDEVRRELETSYTICFCCYQQQVLMLYRTFPPHAQFWNGLGGKIEAGETPLVSVQREMQEEAGIDLGKAPSLFFAGIITWGLTGQEPMQGMYASVAHLSQQQAACRHMFWMNRNKSGPYE